MTTKTFLLTLAAGLVLAAIDLTAATPDSPTTLAAIMQGYNTAASQDLRSVETDFNRDLPAGVPPVTIVDYDKVATWFAMPEGPSTVDIAVGDYLTSKTGVSPTAPTLAQLAAAMNSLDAEGIILPRENGGSCFVVPVYPGLSFNSFYASSFQVGSSDELPGRIVTIPLSTQEFDDFADAHELWHCLDIRYIRDSGDGLAGAVKQNRTEMFADIGGVMEGIRNGADLTLIDKAIAVHSAWAFLTGPAHASLAEENAAHFQSIIYDTAAGLDALRTMIRKMGIATFRQLDRAKLRSLDYQLTDAQCLTYQQAQALQTYYATGRAPADVLPLIARLKAIATASFRTAVPAELEAEKKCTAAAATNGNLTEQALLEKLKARARERGDQTALANQLRARQEMTDQLREKLRQDSSCERVTEAQLKLLLYTNPHLVPRNTARTH